MGKFIRCHECGKKINYGEGFYTADFPDTGSVFCSHACFAEFFCVFRVNPGDGEYDNDALFPWTNEEEEARQREEIFKKALEAIKEIAEKGESK